MLEQFVTEKVTRVDLEDAGGTEKNVIFKGWLDGWSEGDIPKITQLLQGTPIFLMLMELEKAGFTCEMCDQSHGRALRGEIIRIDFILLGPTWFIKSYPYGWTAKTHPLTVEHKPKDEISITQTVEGFKQAGWSVYSWTNPKTGESGIRCFLGEPQPVHDASTVRRMRAQMPYAQGNLAYIY